MALGSAPQLFSLLVVALCILSVVGRPLLRGQGATLVDELEGLRLRLLSTDGFNNAQWTRKLTQDVSGGYGGYGYYYGYYGYYEGGYSGGYASSSSDAARRRSLLSLDQQSTTRELLASSPSYGYSYGYNYGYYGYGAYYGGYVSSSGVTSAMAAGRRRMLGSLEHLSEMMMDGNDGFVRPTDKAYLEQASNGRELLAMPAYGGYGYYGYGYYYGAYGYGTYA